MMSTTYTAQINIPTVVKCHKWQTYVKREHEPKNTNSWFNIVIQIIFNNCIYKLFPTLSYTEKNIQRFLKISGCKKLF